MNSKFCVIYHPAKLKTSNDKVAGYCTFPAALPSGAAAAAAAAAACNDRKHEPGKKKIRFTRLIGNKTRKNQEYLSSIQYTSRCNERKSPLKQQPIIQSPHNLAKKITVRKHKCTTVQLR